LIDTTLKFHYNSTMSREGLPVAQKSETLRTKVEGSSFQNKLRKLAKIGVFLSTFFSTQNAIAQQKVNLGAKMPESAKMNAYLDSMDAYNQGMVDYAKAKQETIDKVASDNKKKQFWENNETYIEKKDWSLDGQSPEAFNSSNAKLFGNGYSGSRTGKKMTPEHQSTFFLSTQKLDQTPYRKVDTYKKPVTIPPVQSKTPYIIQKINKPKIEKSNVAKKDEVTVTTEPLVQDTIEAETFTDSLSFPIYIYNHDIDRSLQNPVQPMKVLKFKSDKERQDYIRRSNLKRLEDQNYLDPTSE